MSEAPRRLVHVFSTFGPGGPQVRAVQLMRHLGARCRHVVMAMDGCLDARKQIPHDLDVEFVECPARRGFLGTVRAQRRWLREIGPDLVLTYNWGAIESVAAARTLRLPLVHHEDGFGPEEVARRFRRRNWFRRFLLAGLPVVVPSSVLVGIAQREWRLRPANVHLLVNGVDLDRFAHPTRSVDGPVAVGTVGGLRGEKDHRTLLEAFAKVSSDAIDRLRIVGEGALRAELEALAADLGIGPRVEFVGAVEDTAPEYRRLDIFVLSSRTEQMPISLLEAMASECAVVATDVGDVRAMLPPGQHAFVVPKEDAAALAAAFELMAGDRATMRRLGAENRKRAVADYEAQRCLERFAALYLAAAN